MARIQLFPDSFKVRRLIPMTAGEKQKIRNTLPDFTLVLSTERGTELTWQCKSRGKDRAPWGQSASFPAASHDFTQVTHPLSCLSFFIFEKWNSNKAYLAACCEN